MTDRMTELVKLLNEASKAYYAEDHEIMSNFEYDRLYDELVVLEKETGITLSDSPTIHVGYEVVSELPKMRHPSPMLSLDKTKEVGALEDWLGDKEGILSWKMDGLTVVLTYENGELTQAVTRGNGETGEVITANARAFKNVPVRVSYNKGRLVIRGEAVISYPDFEEINSRIPETDAKYKNPRNLCSGSVRQLNSAVTAERNVRFYAFSMVDPEDQELASRVTLFEDRFNFLKEMGFQVVEHRKVTREGLADAVKWFASRLPDNILPSDGLVLSYNDIVYGRSLGTTAKFPRDSIAFKWRDEEAETVLREIEWSPSRTGLINPVAIFDPVDLEGTEVRRASLHNISYVKDMQLGIGDTIKVYKANMIIPQISENLTKSGNIIIPDACPACGSRIIIKNDNGTETLNCPSDTCPAKNIKLFSLFVSRNAMNIDGISEATLERFIECGFLHNLSDIYRLSEYKDKIVTLEGFGEKSYNNIIDSIEKSRNADMAGFLYGLGIANIGLSNAKLIVKYFGYDIERIMSATADELCEIEGIGDVIAKEFVSYMSSEQKKSEIERLLKEIKFVVQENNAVQDLEGKTFVITGSLNTFPNRDALKKVIEDRGGKVSGSVSVKTSYLINNDINSASSKNKNAKKLGVPIITEEDFLKL